MKNKLLVTFMLVIILIFTFTINSFAYTSVTVCIVPDEIKEIIYSSEYYNNENYDYLSYYWGDKYSSYRYGILFIEKDDELKFYVTDSSIDPEHICMISNKMFNGYAYEYDTSFNLISSTAFTDADWTNTNSCGYLSIVDDMVYLASSISLYSDNTYTDFFLERGR